MIIPDHPANKIHSLFEDSQGILWVGMEKDYMLSIEIERDIILLNGTNLMKQ